jgi:ribonuclease HII
MPRSPSLTASLSHERDLHRRGRRAVVGVDEAGRGAWAGPVAAGAVVLPPDASGLETDLRGVYDSKKVSARARERLIAAIKAAALAWGVGWAESAEIDAIGIVPATCQAMLRALDALKTQFPDVRPDYMLVDSIQCGLLLTTPGVPPFEALVRGDQRSLSIAAASILAKVSRDQRMIELDAEFPGYGFAAHKGYGAAAHRAALAARGLTPIHRRRFKPMSQMRLEGF